MLSLAPLRRCWWAVAVLAAVCQSPTRAEAGGCGDHSPDSFAAFALADPIAPPPAAQNPTPAPKPATPCQGPNCSRVPVNKGLPVPPAPAPAPVDKELVKGLAVVETPGPTPFALIEPTSARPIRRANAIFHPPRLG